MNDINQFLQFAESLKLVRKAEISIDGDDIIDNIYTDLLPNNGIISKVNLPRTTILTGRKGTGKSTIFQKSQKDIDSNKKYISLYIDVKSLYDNSTPSFPEQISGVESQELIKYLIYTNFIKEIIIKSKQKLKERLAKKYILNVLGLSEVIAEDVYAELENIERSIDEVFKQLNSSIITSYKNTIDKKFDSKEELSIGLNLKEGVNLKAGGSFEKASAIKKEFDNTLITYLDIKKCLIDNLIRIRDTLKIKTLFIYLDDFSEISKDAQILFMDWFIVPLNNLSDDFVKFKIAIYPKRFYYGKLDNSKIDEISLDFFDAFYSYEKKSELIDISKMENLSLDYTKRLINNRFNVYFPNNSWEKFFDMKPQKLYELLFEVSLNTPRKIGFVLSYCYDSCLIHGTPITANAIENAALKYYNDVIEKYFLVNEHICKPFEDKISNEHQYDLLLKIINRQTTNKQVLKRRKNKDASHFYINSNLSNLLDNLELNSFLSTYNKIKDDTGSFSTLYSLDFGLCKKFQLGYGSLGQKKSSTKYSQPIFNFNNLIIDFFNSTQVIVCDAGHEFPYSNISEFRKFQMNCPTCMENQRFSKCEVRKKFGEFHKTFLEKEESKKVLISYPEYMILDMLNLSQTAVSYNRLSELLDMPKVTVNTVLKIIIDKGWCEYDIDASKEFRKDYAKITSSGVKTLERVTVMLENFKEQIRQNN